MKISVRHRFLPKTNSLRASMVMDAFGIDFEQGEHLIADNLELPIEAGQIVAFTGDSGGGKSSLLREVSHQLRTNGASLVSLDEIELPDKILVDVIDLEFSESVRLLSACGLGEAHLLLRTPHELSDGQRYRFRLAKALSQTPDWIIADEYTATLDRTLAKVVSLNLHKLNSRCQTGFLIATTHEDIIPDLNSHLHIRCRLNGQVEVNQQSAAGCKKKDPPSQTTFGSPPRPKPTGRASLGGITAATTSDSSAT